jgi:hypothetical protein
MPLHARYSATVTTRRTRTAHGTLLDCAFAPFSALTRPGAHSMSRQQSVATQNARVDRGSYRRDFLLDTLEGGGFTSVDWKPRSFAHARQRYTRNGLTAVLLLST